MARFEIDFLSEYTDEALLDELRRIAALLSSGEPLTKMRGEMAIKLDRDHFAGGLYQTSSQGSAPRSDLQHGIFHPGLKLGENSSHHIFID